MAAGKDGLALFTSVTTAHEAKKPELKMKIKKK